MKARSKVLTALQKAISPQLLKARQTSLFLALAHLFQRLMAESHAEGERLLGGSEAEKISIILQNIPSICLATRLPRTPLWDDNHFPAPWIELCFIFKNPLTWIHNPIKDGGDVASLEIPLPTPPQLWAHFWVMEWPFSFSFLWNLLCSARKSRIERSLSFTAFTLILGQGPGITFPREPNQRSTSNAERGILYPLTVV